MPGKWSYSVAVKLLDELESGEVSAAQLGFDEIAKLLGTAKKELVRIFAAIEQQRAAEASRSNVISFRRARAQRAAKNAEDAARANRRTPSSHPR